MDGRVAADAILPWKANQNGRVILLGLATDSQPRWVLKVGRSAEPSGWQPRREFRGLEFVAQHLSDVAGFGCIQPIGYSDEGRWLVMRYQPGAPLRPIFDRAIYGITGRQMGQAASLVARLARWLQLFRQETPLPTETNRSSCTQFCFDRLDEIDEAFSGLDGPTNRKVRRIVAELTERSGSDVYRSSATHGDMATQNFILDDGGVLYPLDLEGFTFKPLDEDFALFRSRFESDALHRPWSGHRATRLWRTFCDAYIPVGRDAFCLLAYLHKLLADIAWMGQRSAGRRPLQALRTNLRVRNRLRWLAGLPATVAEAFTYLRDRL